MKHNDAWTGADVQALHLFEEHANSLPPFCEEAKLPPRPLREWALAVAVVVLSPIVGALAARGLG